MKAHLLPVFALLVAPMLPVSAQGHVHGEAALDIGIEGLTGTFELRVPGDDLYGFEHEPRTPAEKAKRDSAVALMKSRVATLVQFDPSLGCTIVPGPVKYSSGKHIEVQARFEIACQKAPAGHDIKFGITKVFPSVQTVRVQLVTESGQSGARIIADKGVVRP